jgi:hypothetical protein
VTSKDMKNVYKIVNVKGEGKKTLAKHGRKWEDDTEMYS